MSLTDFDISHHHLNMKYKYVTINHSDLIVLHRKRVFWPIKMQIISNKNVIITLQMGLWSGHKLCAIKTIKTTESKTRKPHHVFVNATTTNLRIVRATQMKTNCYNE